MNTKRYIVALKKDVDYDAFWQEMEDPTSGLPHIPDRAVGIANNRGMFDRICEYWLTDSEAEKVKNDPRVAGVEIPINDNPNVGIVPQTTQNISGMNYTKQAGNVTVNYITGDSTIAPADYTPPLDASTNWGLIRHSFRSNPYGANPTGASNSTTDQYYSYALDGTNVDVVINDTGIQADHPEFVGRIVYVDWDSIAVAVGCATTTGWNTASYTDDDGHGTNVAGIAAGATYGWGKGANIISLNAFYSNNPLDMFTMLIYWHQTKGNNNPTIVNMSWGYSYLSGIGSGTYYSIITGGEYQGSPILTGQSDSYYQQRGLIALTPNGLPYPDPATYYIPYNSEVVNIVLGYVIDAGIIVCRSAGNNGFKIDKPLLDGGTGDYDNYATFYYPPYSPFSTPTNVYYNKGSSPLDPRMISVGALDTKTSASAQDQRAEFSCAGPGVDIWAAGTYIMSAGSNVSVDTTAPYYLNNSFNELNLLGTSQASPQIAGMGALYLQANPPANIYDPDNCSTVKSWLINNATTDTFYATGNATSYTDGLSLLGGEPRVAYQPLQPINIDAVEVLVGGIQAQTGYTVINTNPVQVQFDEAPPSGVDVTILVRRGVTWYAPGVGTASNGNPLQITETPAARFLRGLNPS